jgi:hypothetical protein
LVTLPGEKSGGVNLHFGMEIPMRVLRTGLLTATLFAVPVAASAADQDFTVVNKTGYQIDDIYTSPHRSSSWGHELMGRGNVLVDGDSFDVNFRHERSACHFDLKVTYHDNTEATWGDLNLCEISTVTLHYNRRTDTTSATYE